MNFSAWAAFAFATLCETLCSWAEVTFVTAITLSTIRASTTTGIIASNNFVRMELTFLARPGPSQASSRRLLVEFNCPCNRPSPRATFKSQLGAWPLGRTVMAMTAGSQVRRVLRAVFGAYRRVPVRWRLGGGSAALTFVILAGVAGVTDVLTDRHVSNAF